MRRVCLFPFAVGLFLLTGCDEGSMVCPNGDCGAKTAPIRTTSVGYLPERAKLASWVGDAAAFRVLREDGSVAFDGEASEPINATDSGELVRVADFSPLTEEGTFTLEVDGVGSSQPFRIAPDVFVEPLKVTMQGFYGQRCGVSVTLVTEDRAFSHGECHLGDATVVPAGGGEPQDATKGWHDAGDYGKYVNNGAFSLGMMLLAYEQWPEKLSQLELDIPEAGGAMPDYLDECAFQLEWLFGMQLPDGSVADRITTQSFDAMISPEASTNPRYLMAASSVATADFAAVMAMSARVYAEFDEELSQRALDAAIRAQAFLDENPDAIQPSRQGFTGGYQSSDRDDRLWAVAELWQATGDEAYLAAFEEMATTYNFDVRGNWDWPDLENMGIFTYLLSEREGRNEDLVDALTTKLVNSADQLANTTESHAYGRALGQMYYWGINGVLARTTMNLRIAERLTGDARYLDAAVTQLDHLFGRNYFGRSQITGIGSAPPLFPHHRPSVASGSAWPGLLVGGPHADAMSGTPAATVWNDKSDDYETNEVAINWNAALAYGLAGFLP